MIKWSKKYSNGSWVVDDYATAKEILGSDQFSVQRAGRWLNTSANNGLGNDLRILKSLLRQSIVFLDGSKHQKIRLLLIQKIKQAEKNLNAFQFTLSSARTKHTPSQISERPAYIGKETRYY